MGLEKSINLWLDIKEVPRQLKFKVADFNIGLLTAFLLKRNWKAKLNLIVLIKDKTELELYKAQAFINHLLVLSRLPEDVNVIYNCHLFEQVIDEVTWADLNILPILTNSIDMQEVRQQFLFSFINSMLFFSRLL